VTGAGDLIPALNYKAGPNAGQKMGDNMNKVTQRDLEAVIKRLNAQAGFQDAKYSTVGAYTLDGAYGGWQLQKYVNERGGVTVISTGGFITKRELYNQVYTLLNVLEAR
jgi:hypothetical protein